MALTVEQRDRIVEIMNNDAVDVDEAESLIEEMVASWANVEIGEVYQFMIGIVPGYNPDGNSENNANP